MAAMCNLFCYENCHSEQFDDLPFCSHMCCMATRIATKYFFDHNVW